MKLTAKNAGRIGFQMPNSELAHLTFDNLKSVSPLAEKAFFFCSGIAETGTSFEQAWELFTDWKRSGGDDGKLEEIWNKKANRE